MTRVRASLRTIGVVLAAGAMLGIAAVIAVVSLAGRAGRSVEEAPGVSRDPIPATAHGEPITPSREMLKQLGPVHGNAPVYLLGHVGARFFYRVQSERSGTCYAAGRVDRFGVILCPREAAPGPLVDLSVVEIAPASDAVTVIRLEGIALGAVRTVRLVAAGGSTILEAPVTRGVYYVENVPAESVAALVALDGAGHVVQRLEYAKGP